MQFSRVALATLVFGAFTAVFAYAHISLDDLPLGLAAEIEGDLQRMEFEEHALADPHLDSLLTEAVVEYQAHLADYSVLHPWSNVCDRWALSSAEPCLQKTFRWLALEHIGNHHLSEQKALHFAQLIRPGRVFRLYDLTIGQFYRLGGRLCARTMVELTKDEYIKTILRHMPSITIDHVIDPFVGSGNTLYHLTRHTQCPGESDICSINLEIAS